MTSPEEKAISVAIVKLMQGVVYRTSHEDVWRTIERDEAAIQDHFARIGVRAVVDPLEGYAFLKTIELEDDADPLPRLVNRRSLTYPVSLMLLLLRKRLAEFEAGGDEGRLVLDLEQLREMLRVFLGDTNNEARMLNQIDATISQIVKLGFLQELRGEHGAGNWEVKRILKAYVDAETMADFAAKLSEYAQTVDGVKGSAGTASSAHVPADAENLSEDESNE